MAKTQKELEEDVSRPFHCFKVDSEVREPEDVLLWNNIIISNIRSFQFYKAPLY